MTTVAMPWETDSTTDRNIRLRQQSSDLPLPLHFVRPFKENGNWFRIFKREFLLLFKQQQAKKLLFLLIVHIVGTFILLTLCKVTASIALLAYWCLSIFSLLSLLTSILCIWAEIKVANFSYTFGFLRCEVLAVFSSIIVTLLGALFIIKESVEGLIAPESLNGGLIHISCSIMLSNLIMMRIVTNAPLNHVLRISTSSLLQEHVSDICYGLCVHWPRLRRLFLPRCNPLLLLNIIGCILILSNHIMVHSYYYKWADPVHAIIMSLFIMFTMFPLASCSAKILLQSIPKHLVPHLEKCLRDSLTVEGVLELRNESFWFLGTRSYGGMLRDGIDGGDAVLVGTLHVRVRREANEQRVAEGVAKQLRPLVSNLTVQVFKDWKKFSSTLQLLRKTSVPPSASLVPPRNIKPLSPMPVSPLSDHHISLPMFVEPKEPVLNGDVLINKDKHFINGSVVLNRDQSLSYSHALR